MFFQQTYMHRVVLPTELVTPQLPLMKKMPLPSLPSTVKLSQVDYSAYKSDSSFQGQKSTLVYLLSAHSLSEETVDTWQTKTIHIGGRTQFKVMLGTIRLCTNPNVMAGTSNGSAVSTSFFFAITAVLIFIRNPGQRLLRGHY